MHSGTLSCSQVPPDKWCSSFETTLASKRSHTISVLLVYDVPSLLNSLTFVLILSFSLCLYVSLCVCFSPHSPPSYFHYILTWISWWFSLCPNLSALQVFLIAAHLGISTVVFLQQHCSPKQLVTVHAKIFISLHKTPSMLQAQMQKY